MSDNRVWRSCRSWHRVWYCTDAVVVCRWVFVSLCVVWWWEFQLEIGFWVWRMPWVVLMMIWCWKSASVTSSVLACLVADLLTCLCSCYCLCSCCSSFVVIGHWPLSCRLIHWGGFQILNYSPPLRTFTCWMLSNTQTDRRHSGTTLSWNSWPHKKKWRRFIHSFICSKEWKDENNKTIGIQYL